jgi:sterol desaturase/sphingolipid hydroxylase (fatty acid hydroxylase superfamily)
VVLNTVLVRLLFPMTAVGVAALCAAKGWGLLNYLGLPLVWAVPLAIVALDLAIWAQHVATHHVPWLWRLHRVHHADVDYDLTTGSRFHPLEIVLFEVLLSSAAMFNHGNIRLPLVLDRVLRWAIVTPDMHRVHHSVHMDEANRNFGFNLPWWDRLFGTYRSQPRAGHEGMGIGLHGHSALREVARLDGMLALPFKSP